MPLPAFTVMEGVCGLSHVPTEEPHCKRKKCMEFKLSIKNLFWPWDWKTISV